MTDHQRGRQLVSEQDALEKLSSLLNGRIEGDQVVVTTAYKAEQDAALARARAQQAVGEMGFNIESVPGSGDLRLRLKRSVPQDEGGSTPQ